MVSSDGFGSLGIPSPLLKSLSKKEINVPTEVQSKVIPAVLERKSLIVQSPTGTGKTLAYLLPLLAMLDKETKDLEVLILVPSRELVFQVIGVIQMLVPNMLVAALSGGVNLPRQLASLKDKPKIAVGTPGRVLELFQKKKLNGQVIRAVVVDEVDKMFSAGFMGDVLAILKKTLRSRQVLFFSATIPGEVLNKASELMEQPHYILIKGSGKVPEEIRHYYLLCERSKKFTTLEKLLKVAQPKHGLVFITRPEGVASLAEYLQKKGFQAVGLHSDLTQNERKNIIKVFRESKASVLITTDLLARGMDFVQVDYVFNFDLPLDAKHYLHRVGRTGRAGKSGIAISLVAENQKFILYRVARDLGVTLKLIGLDEEKIFVVRNQRK